MDVNLTYSRAVLLLFLVGVISAFINGFSDCDEVYNFIEPLHYIIYGKGFQTWEYSPSYALRSYFYILIHATVVYPLSLITGDKIMIFTILRIVLALFNAVGGGVFFNGVTTKFGVRAGKYTLAFMACNTGLFIASTAMLPNTFCMVCTMLSFGFWFEGRHWPGVFYAGCGVLIGWPYTGLLFASLAFDSIFIYGFMPFLLRAGLMGTVLLTLSCVVDFIYYQRFIIPVLNHVAYNVFGGGGGAGSELYGSEPASFYFINTFLNCNLPFILFLLFPFLAVLVPSPSRVMTKGKLFAYISPAYLWFFFMVIQPHKEERFLFVIYPLICHIAALSLERGRIAIAGGVALFVPSLIEPISAFCTRLIVLFTLLLSLSRTVSLYKNYNASVEVYKHLYYLDIPETNFTVCVGKEWYRFPSHFYIPQNGVLQFLKSGFSGQLPQHFGLNTYDIPLHMNNMNEEEVTRYVNVEECNFIVDFNVLDQKEARLDDAEWEIIFSSSFLDTSRSPSPYRSFYIPYLSADNNVYVDYMLRRKK